MDGARLGLYTNVKNPVCSSNGSAYKKGKQDTRQLLFLFAWLPSSRMTAVAIYTYPPATEGDSHLLP